MTTNEKILRDALDRIAARMPDSIMSRIATQALAATSQPTSQDAEYGELRALAEKASKDGWNRGTFGQLGVQDSSYMLSDADAQYIAAANPQAILAILNSRAQLVERVAVLEETNRKLHRRLQAVEGPYISYKHQINEAWDAASSSWVGTFKRMGVGFKELQCAFRHVARAYPYPQDAKSMHSCMDSDAEHGGTAIQDKVFANCFETPTGGMKSFHVVTEVARAVDELLELRKATPHPHADEAANNKENK